MECPQAFFYTNHRDCKKVQGSEKPYLRQLWKSCLKSKVWTQEEKEEEEEQQQPKKKKTSHKIWMNE